MFSIRSLFPAALAAAVVGVGAWLPGPQAEDKTPTEGVYELRVYTTHEGRLPALQARFRDHTMQLFEKHGMKNVMYWTPADPAKSENTLIYIIWHKSQEAAKESFKAFSKDPEWVAARNASEADGKIVEKVESTYMKRTEWSPTGH